jgi:hypothetical protein
MLNDDETEPGIRGHAAEKLFERLKPSGRRTNTNDIPGLASASLLVSFARISAAIRFGRAEGTF